MTEFTYKGHKVEIKRESLTPSRFYYSVIDDRYRSSLQSTENIAAFYAMKHIDSEEAKVVQPSALSELEYIVKQHRSTKLA